MDEDVKATFEYLLGIAKEIDPGFNFNNGFIRYGVGVNGLLGCALVGFNGKTNHGFIHGFYYLDSDENGWATFDISCEDHVREIFRLLLKRHCGGLNE